MLTDSHCHLDRIDLADFDDTLEGVFSAARENQVGRFLNVCIDLEHFPEVQTIALTHENVWCSVGVHPTSENVKEPTVDELVELGRSEKVIAIGETGLDYFRIEQKDADWQRDRFRRHIQGAVALNKPLIIHTRSARADTIKILQEEGADRCKGIMHCFAEDWETASKAIELGFYISFSGIITFKNAEELREVAAKVPEDRILIETDAPYLAPVPYRGKMNHPALVWHVAEKLAEIRGWDVDKAAQVSSDNFSTLFPITAR
jgi:TatD DNase family protein